VINANLDCILINGLRLCYLEAQPVTAQIALYFVQE
jgi:hypothetical protein